MRFNRSVLGVVAFSALSLGGCAKYLDKFSRLSGYGVTSVQFVSKNESASTASVMIGGAMVYAIRTDGNVESFRLDSETDQREFQLPNGTYKFITVGWDASGLTGNTKCGVANKDGSAVPMAFDLTGTATTIPITISATNCADNAFADANFRSTATFSDLDFVFCGGTVNVDSLGGGSDCTAGRESYRFFVGNQSGGQGADDIDVSYDGKYFIYTSDPHQDGRMEVFSVRYDGTGTVKINPPLVSGGTVVADMWPIRPVPSTDKLVYMAKQNNASVPELFLGTVGQPGATSISGTVDNMSAGWGVKQFEITEDGRYVIFVGQMENTFGVPELYSIDLQTAGYPRTKLNQTAIAGGGVYGSGTPTYYNFEVSRQAPYKVIFAAALGADSALENHVYIVNPDGTGHTKLSNPACANTASEIHALRFNYNSTKVIWDMDCAVDNTFTIFASAATGGTIYDISGPVTNGTSRVLVDRKHDQAIFGADPGAANQMDVVSVDFTTLNQTAIDASRFTLYDETTTMSLQLGGAVFSDDGTKVAYVRDAGSGFNKLYGASLAPATLETLLSTVIQSPGMPTNFGDHDGPMFFDASNNVYFLSDSAAHAGRDALFKGPTNLAGSLVGLNPTAVPNAANSDVMHASLAPNGKVYYTMDTNANDAYVPIAFDPSGPSNTSLDFSAEMGSTIELYFPQSEGYSFPGYPNGIVVFGTYAAVAGNHEDIWSLEDYTAASPVFHKLTRNWNGGTKLGRYKIVLLSYRGNGAGSVEVTGPGIESACLTAAGASDGMTTGATGIRLPAGPIDTANNPFAVAIDVYGEATSCSGSFSRILLPRGLANHDFGGDAARAKSAGAGATARIFVRD